MALYPPILESLLLPLHPGVFNDYINSLNPLPFPLSFCGEKKGEFSNVVLFPYGTIVIGHQSNHMAHSYLSLVCAHDCLMTTRAESFCMCQNGHKNEQMFKNGMSE